MNLTIGEFKEQPLYKKIDSLFNNIHFHKRIQPLLNVIIFIQTQVPIKNKLELYNATGALERKFNQFCRDSKYSEYHHHDEVVYIRAVVEIIRENEKEPFNEDSLINLIKFFLIKN